MCPSSRPAFQLPGGISAPLTLPLPWMTVRGTVVCGHFLLGSGGFLQLHSTRICRGKKQRVWVCLAGPTHQGALVFAGWPLLSTPWPHSRICSSPAHYKTVSCQFEPE